MNLYKITPNETEVIRQLNESQQEILNELGITFERQAKYEIVKSSPAVATVGKLSLPLQDLKPGFSMPVPFDVTNSEPQLRTYVSRTAKKLGFKLRVIKHEQCYEIARVE
jgi:transcriptional regulator with XRE-family HTH domain